MTPDVRPFAELTRGPVATVYKALDQTSGRVVVLKKVHTYDPGRRERFTAEARLAAGVEHPNVVQVLHVTDDSLVAEWVEGADLDDVVADVGALPPELAAFVARETALGLGAVHAAGILHRDVSAANVLLSLEGEVKLTDFGLASLADDAGDEVRGTLGTMAPEVVRGQAPGAGADLFSLGAVLVHALTGRPPFASDDASGTLDAVLHQDPAAALGGDPRIPDALAEIARSLLEKDPASRPADAGAVADRLSVVLEALGSPGPGHLASFLTAPDAYRSPTPPGAKRKRMLPPPAPPRRAVEPEPDAEPLGPARRSRRAPALAAAVLVVGLAGIVFATRDQADGPPPVAVAEEPPAVRPVEVEDDSLVAVADAGLEGGPADEPVRDATPDPPPSGPSDDPPAATPRPPTPPRNVPADRPAPAAAPESPPPAERAVGSLTFDSQPWSTVKLGERVLGNTPIRGLELPAGEYELTLVKEGFPPVPVTVYVEAGEQTGMTVPLYNTVARVQLRVVPWANVSVDGEPWATVPPQRLLILAPGRHTLTFENPALGRPPVQRRIDVAEGDNLTIDVNMMEE